MKKAGKDIEKALRKREDVLTIEAPSYRGSKLEKYFRESVESSVFRSVDYINICDNPVGKVHIDPFLLGNILMDNFGVSPIAHLTCRNSTLSSIQKRLLGADAAGIKNLLVVSGDGGIGDYGNEFTPSYMSSRGIIDGIKNHLNEGRLMPDHSKRGFEGEEDLKTIENSTDFTVGGVIIPGRKNELRYTKNKIKNGVDFLQTQIVYDKDRIYSFIEELSREVDDCPPILMSVRPVSSFEEIRYIAENIPQVEVPDSLLKEMKRTDEIRDLSIDTVLDIFDFVKNRIKEDSLDVDVGLHIIPGDDHDLSESIVEEVKR
ncbi:MAG: methylenetetrahydrofolate reductase [Candidatus Thermoplasmatota archaeon]|nr:methylenetetrahydrofolate reductase [Candidatus Thermoplasmatota archaeon]